jgi:hypothetical protein
LHYVARTRKTECVVYAKPPFAGPDNVLQYVAHYTHRVAISNNRLLGVDDGQVQFRWKDYCNGSQLKTMALAADEFIRRSLLDVLPEGFQRIRYYGFLDNRYREQKLVLCRQLPHLPPREPSNEPKKDYRDRYEQLTGTSPRTCPVCHRGHMVIIEAFDGPTTRPPTKDTS